MKTQKSITAEIIYGRHPVSDALESGRTFEKILMSTSLRGDYEKWIRKCCKEANIPLQNIPKERLNAITRKNHQGIIGFVSPIPFYTKSIVCISRWGYRCS